MFIFIYLETEAFAKKRKKCLRVKRNITEGEQGRDLPLTHQAVNIKLQLVIEYEAD
jgi:hypothetical protein